MFLSMPSAFLSKHSPRLAGVGSYVLFDTNVTCIPGPFDAANSRALRTYLQTFLLYPIMMDTPAAAASAFIDLSSTTVGAPGGCLCGGCERGGIRIGR